MAMRTLLATFAVCLLLGPVSSTAHVHELKQACMEFLHRHMPEKDRDLIGNQFLLTNVYYALRAHNLTPWGSRVPWNIFLNDVLPYAVLNEERDYWRPLFFHTLSPLILQTSSIEKAASTINARIWNLWNLTFVAGQTPQTMSPFQVLKARNASCTGFSIFLVDSLRSVGVPARVVGTPEWNDASGGNHDWVEVWFDNQWNFIDAFDGTKFNEGWFVPSPVKFQLPNSGNHSIYASSFESTSGDIHFPLAWDFRDHSVPGTDVTQWYLDFIDKQSGMDSLQASETSVSL